jgi:hypothetical protein
MVTGVLNLTKCIKKITDMYHIDITPAIKDATRIVQATAKDLAPVDTGTLRGSIKTRVLHRRGKDGSPWAYGIVFTPLEYAIYQEFGWTIQLKNGGERVVYGQPFMNPALDLNRKKIQTEVKDFVRSELLKLKAV